MCDVSHKLPANPVKPMPITIRRSTWFDDHAAITVLSNWLIPTTNTVVPISRLLNPRTRPRNTGKRYVEA